MYRIFLVFYYICLCVYVCEFIRAPAHGWRAENQVWELARSLFPVTLKTELRLGSKHFCPLSPPGGSPSIRKVLYVLNRCIFLTLIGQDEEFVYSYISYILNPDVYTHVILHSSSLHFLIEY